MASYRYRQALAVFLGVLLASPALGASTQDPIWVAVISRVAPIVDTIVKTIFQKNGDSAKLNSSAKLTDAQKKLTTLSEGVSNDLKSSMTKYVLQLIGWRQMMNDLSGAGSLADDGSLRGSILQIKVLAVASDWYSDNSLDSAIESIDRLNGTAAKQWNEVWKTSQDKPLPGDVVSDLGKLRAHITSLASAVVDSRKAKSPADKRTALKRVGSEADSAKTEIDGISMSWDHWLRALGVDLLTLMDNFGAKPDPKVQQANNKNASATAEVKESTTNLGAIHDRLADVSQKVRDKELAIQEYRASTSPTTLNGGGFQSKSQALELMQDDLAALTTDKQRLEGEEKLAKERLKEATLDLDALRALPNPSAEQILTIPGVLAGSGTNMQNR